MEKRADLLRRRQGAATSGYLLTRESSLNSLPKRAIPGTSGVHPDDRRSLPWATPNNRVATFLCILFRDYMRLERRRMPALSMRWGIRGSAATSPRGRPAGGKPRGSAAQPLPPKSSQQTHRKVCLVHRKSWVFNRLFYCDTQMEMSTMARRRVLAWSRQGRTGDPQGLGRLRGKVIFPTS